MDLEQAPQLACKHTDTDDSLCQHNTCSCDTQGVQHSQPDPADGSYVLAGTQRGRECSTHVEGYGYQQLGVSSGAVVIVSYLFGIESWSQAINCQHTTISQGHLSKVLQQAALGAKAVKQQAEPLPATRNGCNADMRHA